MHRTVVFALAILLSMGTAVAQKPAPDIDVESLEALPIEDVMVFKDGHAFCLHEAALEATRRIPLAEMQMFATGLSIQSQTGSSLSEVLMNLSGVIRARFRLKRKIKALSSEAVASASIIGALPILVATGMYFVNYDYIQVLFTDPFGKTLLAGAIFWMLCGIFVMKQMINFRI